jgi:hypothetical protein
LAQAATTKNKKDARLFLVPELLERLKNYRPIHPEKSARVFPQGLPRAERLKVDEKKNGIVYCDSDGRYADFHAFRYTWGTFLQRHGVSLRLAMQMMRHSDSKLKLYTDESQLPTFEKLQTLPPLFERAHGRAQDSARMGKSGRNLSHRRRTGITPKALKIKTPVALCRRLSWGVDWSERRDSNPRRSPWQGDALPD